MARQTQFSGNLLRWYGKNARDLPWRRTRDPYKIWISEIMLQQTTVNAVIPYYERWVKIFPTVRQAAKAPRQKILKAWQGLGYYQRAKNVHQSAKIICKRFKGKIPDTFKDLEILPGFGPYTIGAVLSIAFNKKYPIIDANVRRVSMRYLSLRGEADTRHDRQILQFLAQSLPDRKSGAFNQALMELGALVCRNREPLCNICPVRRSCKAYKEGLQELIPKPKQRVFHDIDVAVAIIKRDGRYLIQRRPPGGLFADLWEFPGGKIEKNETAREALFREVREELSIELKSARPIMSVKQFYTQFRANLHVWLCMTKSNPALSRNRRWVSLSNLRKYPMPSGSAKILDKLFPL